MKIVQVITALNLGGAQTLLENLSYGLVEEGQNVTVVSLESNHTGTAQRLEVKGIPVIYLDKKPHFDPHVSDKLADVLKEIQPDVIHAHNIRKYYVLSAARKAGCRNLFYTIHNIAQKEQGIVGGLFSFFAFHTGLFVPVGLSPLVTQSIQERYHLKFVPTVYNGTDLAHFHQKNDYRLHNHPVILNVARLDEEKNHRRLLDAFSIIEKEYPEAELVIVGDGVLRSQLESRATEIGITSKVHFEGLQNDVARYLEQADVFCLTSDYEGQPMTLIEAMASGLPIVSTNVGGIPDMLSNDSTALLVEPDTNKIAQAVILLLSNPKLRRKLGKRALHASEKFSHRRMAKSYLALYERVIKRRVRV